MVRQVICHRHRKREVRYSEVDTNWVLKKKAMTEKGCDETKTEHVSL